MIATIQKVDNYFVIKLSGGIDFNTCGKFDNTIMKSLGSFEANNVIFDFYNLDFVGSSGIEKFFSFVKNKFGIKIRCTGLKTEFKHCLKAFTKADSVFLHFPSVNEAIQDAQGSIQDDLPIYNNQHQPIDLNK